MNGKLDTNMLRFYTSNYEITTLSPPMRSVFQRARHWILVKTYAINLVNRHVPPSRLNFGLVW